MSDLVQVLLLGGSQHLRQAPVGPDFGTPISHCDGEGSPERYHRAVFYPAADNETIAKVWYVYVSDDYQTQSNQLTEVQLLETLLSEKIAPHIVSVKLADLKIEKRLETI